MKYWGFFQKDLQPCYDHGVTAFTDLLLNPLETNREVLKIMAERLQPDKSLNFTLEIYPADNTSSTGTLPSGSASTTVVTQKNSIPLVSDTGPTVCRKMV